MPLAPILWLAVVAADVPALVDRFETDRRALERFHDLAWAPTRLDRLDAFADDWRARLAALDFDALDRDDKIDAILLANRIEEAAGERAAIREHSESDRPFLPFAETIVDLEEARWTLTERSAQAAATTLDRLKGEVEDVRRSVEDADDDAEDGGARPSAEQAKRLAAKVADLKRWLGRWHGHDDAFDPTFGWWTEAPMKALEGELDAYARMLRRDVAGLKGEDDDPIVGQPLGSAALTRALAHQIIAYSPAEVVEIGEREFAWCDDALAAAATEMGLDGDGAAAIERVKEMHVAPGEQDDLVRALALEAIAFLDDRELVTIPPLCRETWRVDMMSPRDQRFTPFAYYGGQRMVTAYPTSSMSHETKRERQRGNNIPFTRCVTPHELIPGHHLQGFQGQRHRTHRSPFRTPFLGEGWCLYWEMRFLELGWARTPAERIGMLVWRRHRAARIILSLKYHLGEMTSDEMITFLVDRAGLEPDGATGEVRRWIDGGYGPLYQCAYMTGGLQVRALRREVGNRMTERAFHDAVLEQNSIPIELIRAAMIDDVPLSREFKAGWRFADA